ncbi:PDZ and LIM domain protein Zasp-like isoform X1 [Uloborus diversus]|uniref:PDZ and LIM domain protein Zasp-like isoform X1 n=1 Tax=Uloborus diversus TaxID=327109 RepID=UPI0024092F66|nr:PDZ and LIM domain protein Zasp-like isoform X1 [Uloborus diversus]
MSAQTLTVKLSRGDPTTSWGFRLQGGKDFSAPLSVQRVNPGSLSEQAGLMTGDAILKIMGKSTEHMKHKEAQDTIIKSGNNFELVIQRGGVRVWKPTVTPIGDLPTVTTPPATGLYTKTSLAAKKQESTPIGTKHNVSPRPFAPLGGGKVLVNNQYNTPAALYSMNNIADTLSAHTEVLASGAKGINFMKEAPPVNKESAVYRMLMEEKEGSTDHFNHVDQQQPYRKDSPMVQPQVVTSHVSAPITKPASQTSDKPGAPNACVECGKSIIGVFVRIKDKSLHPECFKCSTCGTSLKNVGYFNVSDKLYCEAHAKLAAKIAASAPTYEPLVISQSLDNPVPNAASPTPQTPITAPLSPSAYRSVSPVPFHKPGDIHHVEAPQSPQPVLSPPVFKPNLDPPPFTSPASTSPFKMPTPQVAPPVPASNIPTSTPGTGGPGHKFVWPPQKNTPAAAEPALTSNITPTLPSYRPPPGTQHAASIPKYASPLSPTPQVSSSTPPSMITPPSVKVPPTTSPKPRNPVQSNKAQTWNTSSSMTTTMSSASGNMPSGVAMSAGTGSRPAPRRGRGQMKQQVGPGARIPICNVCGTPIRGPFILALGKSWCPDHFLCANNRCQRSLADVGFVEDRGQLYCENCYEAYLAPTCSKCASRIKGDCLNALNKQWHPNCFVCAYCHKPFGNSSFYMEDGQPYCEKDWNELFTTKCVGCGFPIEAGDRWVEALNNNYHSQCFRCTICNKGLEGQSFYAKSGKPFCKAHSR